MKKLLSLLLALAMVFSLAACSGGGNGGTEDYGSEIDFDEEPYEVSIQFVGLFESNNDVAAVEEALNAITVPKINCKVDIVPLFIGDLPSTTSMGVAGGEKLDIVTVGLTSSMSNMVKDDLLLPLDDLLAARGQAALEVTKNVAEAQKINGKTYGVSGYSYAAIAGGFVYNADMAKEYGIDMHDGMTMEDLSAVGEILKEHGVYLTNFGNGSQLFLKYASANDYFGSAGEYGCIIDPANSTTIVNTFETQEIRDYFKAVKSWNDAGYLPVGQLTDTNTSQDYIRQQTIFGCHTAYTANQLASWQFGGFESGLVMTSDALITTGGAVEFMLGIAANCKRPDKAMDLINLIYSDPEVANLLQYGIEGLDYVAVEGTKNVITREGTSNADGNGYSSSFVHFGNPMDLKILAPLTDSLYDDMRELENSAKKSKAFGYSFNADDFSAETAAINNVLAEKLPALNAGEVADVDAALDDLIAALKTAGIDNVIAANQAQLDAYLGK